MKWFALFVMVLCLTLIGCGEQLDSSKFHPPGTVVDVEVYGSGWKVFVVDDNGTRKQYLEWEEERPLIGQSWPPSVAEPTPTEGP